MRDFIFRPLQHFAQCASLYFHFDVWWYTWSRCFRQPSHDFFFPPSCGWNGSTELKARTWIIHAPPPLWGDSSILISQGDTGTCYWNINTNSHAACSRRAVQVSGDSCRALLFALRRVTAALVPAAFSICKFNSRGRSQDPAARCQ